MVDGAALLTRRLTDPSHDPAWGSNPVIPTAKPQGAIPTLKMPTAKGWKAGCPALHAGLKSMPLPKISTILVGFRCYRMATFLAAESMNADRPPRSLFDSAMVSTMRRAAAMGVSANRITLLRDDDNDGGVAEIREVFLEGLNQPFGMALIGNTFYVGNTDSLMAFPYTPGATRIMAPERKLATFKRNSGKSVGVGAFFTCPGSAGYDFCGRAAAILLRSSCQVAEHCWDPVGHAIVTYGYLFDRLIQARQREV